MGAAMAGKAAPEWRAFCPTCGNGLEHVRVYNRWYCTSCKKWMPWGRAGVPPVDTAAPQRYAPLRDKGRLLLEEGPEEVQERSRSFKRGCAVLLAISLPLVVVGALGLLTFGRLWLPMFMILSIGLMLIPLALVLYVTSARLKPIRIYENGIEGFPAVGRGSIFYSFGELTGFVERKNPIDGHICVFTTKTGQGIALRKSMRGLSEMLGTILVRVGDPRYLVKLEPTSEGIASSRRLEYGLYAMAVLVAFLVTAISWAMANPGDPLDVYLAGLGLTMPILVIASVTFVALAMRRRLGKVVPSRPNVRIPAAIVVVMLVFSFVSHAVFSNAFGPSPEERHIGPKPTSTAVSPGTYANRTVYADGHVLVDAGQTTELRDSTLVMNLTSDKQFGIWVAPGGTLVLDNVTVRPSTLAYSYTFEVLGSARITNGTILGLWGEWDDYDGGLEIYSDDVRIEGVNIRSARQSTILVVDSSPLIANSTIEGAGDDGIELQNSTARILNNTIRNCEWAMYIYGGSRPLVEGNLISHNSFGFLIHGSDPVILENVFEYNEHVAVTYGQRSSPTFHGNTYVGNGTNVVREGSMELSEMCMVATVVAAAVSLAVLYSVQRPAIREEDALGGDSGNSNDPGGTPPAGRP